MKSTRTLFAVTVMAASLVGIACKKEAPHRHRPPKGGPEQRRTAAAGGDADRAGQLGGRRQARARGTFERRREGQHHRVGLHRDTGPRAALTAKWSFQTGQTIDSTSQTVAAVSGRDRVPHREEERLAGRPV